MKGELDPLALREAMIALLQPAAPVRKALDDLGPLDRLDFDWAALRLLVHAKLWAAHHEDPRGRGISAVARELGVADTTLGMFVAGNRHMLSVATTMRLMAWVGYTDLAEFVKDDDS